jgi:uncharacterized protein YyaL (SSP411 family)
MRTELQTDGGGFAAALDADSEGEEGRFYVWEAGEFATVLTDAGLGPAEVAEVAAHWDVAPGGNWEGRSILHREGPPAEPELVERARTALFARREARVRPGRDDKTVAAWNGLALRALATGALVLREDRFLEATGRLVAFIRAVLLRDGDRLWRSARDGAASVPGFAEDYAMVADGLLAAHAARGETDDLLLAEALMARLATDFWDEATGTLFDTGPEHEAAVARPRSLLDGATPGANSVAADVWLRLALLTGEAEHDRRARRILAAVGPALERQPTAFGRMLCAADRALRPPVDVVVAGEADDPRSVALRRAAAAPYAPDLVITAIAPGDGLGERPLYAGKTPRDGAPTAYVCRGVACEAPTADPATVRAQVAGLAAGAPAAD